MWNTIEKLRELVDKIPYNDAVLDINYLENKLLTLIEINPGCRWHGAGSSLFKWQELSHIKKENKNNVFIKIYTKK